MPLQQTSGAASYDAFGGGAPVAAKYIEDFFSAWLRTGTGSSQTVTTGIKENTGALVISKSRSAATDWAWYDTFRGATKDLVSNSTAAETTQSQGLTSFNADGHTWGTLAKVNTSGATYVDYVLKPQPKFFDVVTYTGNGVAGRQIPHNLGATPGMVIVKSLAADQWATWHRGLTSSNYIVLNSTAAQTTAGAVNRFGNGSTTVDPTSTVFTVGSNGEVNQSGNNYVAYLFAHNAGGFGESGTDNVISCGSFTTDGSGNATVNIGYEPQWVLYKPSTAINNWKIFDNMRGMVVGNGDKALYPNTSGAEVQDDSIQPAATGFSIVGGDASATHIYIAIRRGPMKVPTTGTSVFAPTAATAASGTYQTTGFPIDTQFSTVRSSGGSWVNDRLRGFSEIASPGVNGPIWITTGTAAESTSTGTRTAAWDNTQFMVGGNVSNTATVWWSFRRAPSFMDVVCYTGTGANVSRSHNLGVTPELWIVRRRNSLGAGIVGASAIANTEYLVLNDTAAKATLTTYWNSTYPTASVFTTGTNSGVNANGGTYVAYFFASCPGVSRVGSYTGNDNTAAQGGQTINCGFTGSARFILIKCTSSAENWYVWDSARGIVPGNDPSLTLNTTAAEDAGYDAVDAVAGGFIVNNNNASNLNTSGQSYIFLAIA